MDQTCFRFYDPETKQKSTEWKYLGLQEQKKITGNVLASVF